MLLLVCDQNTPVWAGATGTGAAVTANVAAVPTTAPVLAAPASKHENPSQHASSPGSDLNIIWKCDRLRIFAAHLNMLTQLRPQPKNKELMSSEEGGGQPRAAWARPLSA